MPREISKLTILSKKDIYKELEELFGKDDESNAKCYNCIKYHLCPLSDDDPFCTSCIIGGATWIFEDYEVGD